MKKIFFVFLFFVSQSNASGLPKGLKQAGNTCYMNSSIQCVYNIEPLTNFLLKNQNTDYYNNKTTVLDLTTGEDKTYDSIAKKFTELISKLQIDQKENDRSPVDPIEFCEIMWPAFGFPVGGQWDAGEFITKLFRHLMDLDVNRSKVKQWYGFNLDDQPREEINKLFDIGLKSVLSCTGCDKKSSSGDKQFQLSLAIPKSENEPDLTGLLNNFFAKEKQEEKTQCPEGCKQTQAFKQFFLNWAPPYLIIQLNRFHRLKDERKTIKINTPVKIPLTIELNEYFEPEYTPKTKVTYELVSFVQHAGSYEGGHYTAIIKNNKNWYVCDDHTTYQFDQINLLETTGIAQSGFTPFILFFKKTTPGIIESTRPQISTGKELSDGLAKKGITEQMLNLFLEKKKTILNDNSTKKISLQDLINGINQGFTNFDKLADSITNFYNSEQKKLPKKPIDISEFYNLQINLRALSN